MRHLLFVVLLAMLTACNGEAPPFSVRVESTASFDALDVSKVLAEEIALGVGQHRAVVAALMTLAPDGIPARTVLDVTRTPHGFLATAIFDGVPDDDSVSGHQYSLTLVETDSGALQITDARRSHRCWPGRGHRDFSIKPCT
jgi:hypothetical protein